MMEDADRERIWLEENVPGLIKNLRQEVSMRLLRKQDVDFFIESLKKAGLADRRLKHPGDRRRTVFPGRLQLITFRIVNRSATHPAGNFAVGQ